MPTPSILFLYNRLISRYSIHILKQNNKKVIKMKSLEVCLLKQKSRARSLEVSECHSGMIRINKINFDDYDKASAYLSSIPVNSASSLAMSQLVTRKKKKTGIDAEMRAEAKVLLGLIDVRSSAKLDGLRPILMDIAKGSNLSASCITPSDFLRSVRRQLTPGF